MAPDRAYSINELVHVSDTSGNITYAEQRLWAAVICLLIDDYEAVLRHITTTASSANRTVCSSYLRQLKALRREATSAWFQIICENTNVHHSHITRKLDSLDAAFSLTSYEFVETTPQPEQYDRKEARRERKFLRIS